MNRVAEAVADKLLGKKRYKCDYCAFEIDDRNKLADVDELTVRVDPGGIMPAGECPDCGCLIYGGDQDVIDAGLLFHFAAVLRRQGYIVIEPSE